MGSSIPIVTKLECTLRDDMRCEVHDIDTTHETETYKVSVHVPQAGGQQNNLNALQTKSM